MSITLYRVINEHATVVNGNAVNVGPVLIDKIDRSQSNFTNYAQIAKQKIYIPRLNPVDTSVKGYVDLVPTDDVLLSVNNGTISGLASSGVVSVTAIASSLVSVSTVTAASNAASTTTIGGTTFTSVSPDKTYAILTNLSGISQTVPSTSFSSFSNTSIQIADGSVTIGTPTTGWKVKILANSKYSNQFTLT